MNSTWKMMIGVMVGCLLIAGSVWGAAPGNGTVTIGGLVWLKNADCFYLQTLDGARNSCGSLKSGSCGLSDGSTAGQWRLPSSTELNVALNNISSFTNPPSRDAFYYWSDADTAKVRRKGTIGSNGGNGGAGGTGDDGSSTKYVLCVRYQ